jgi:hypothetical protein
MVPIAEIVLDVPSATILGALVGGVAASLVNFVAQCVARHYETKRQFRDLAIKAALENWRHQNDLKISLMKAGGTGNISIEAPDAYICHMLRIMEIAADTGISSQEAATRISKIRESKGAL